MPTCKDAGRVVQDRVRSCRQHQGMRQRRITGERVCMGICLVVVVPPRPYALQDSVERTQMGVCRVDQGLLQ
jgi:hypothetical protein